jgi:hypothetical protein
MHFVNMNNKKQRIWGMRDAPDATINVRGDDTERGGSQALKRAPSPQSEGGTDAHQGSDDDSHGDGSAPNAC